MKTMMVMETMLHTHVCSCSQHSPEREGETCEICMGVIQQQNDLLSSILPEMKFDERYFEELEAYFEHQPIAA